MREFLKHLPPKSRCIQECWSVNLRPGQSVVVPWSMAFAIVTQGDSPVVLGDYLLDNVDDEDETIAKEQYEHHIRFHPSHRRHGTEDLYN